MQEHNSSPNATSRHIKDAQTQLALEMRAGDYVVMHKHRECGEVVEQIHTFSGILCTRRTPVASYMHSISANGAKTHTD